MPEATKPRSRRRTYLLLLLLLLVAIGGGAFWVIRRGQRRTGLFEKAVAAAESGDKATAERLFRDLLKANPRSVQARLRLMDLLLESRRLDEAKTLAEEWTEVGPQEVVGWRFLIEIALRKMEFPEAARLVRHISDTDPEYAQMTVLRVRDTRGDPASLWEAHNAALQLAGSTRDPVRKAELLLYAAETLLDLATSQPEAARAAVSRRAARYVEDAQRALAMSTAGGATQKALGARLDLLSDLKAKQEQAVRTLRDLAAAPKAAVAPTIHAALAAHYTRIGDAASAAEQVRSLGAGHIVQWLRGVRRLAASGHVAEALSLLPSAPDPTDPLIVLLAAALRLRQGDAEKAGATADLLALAERTQYDPGVSLEAYQLLTGAGREAESLQVLDAVVRKTPDPVLEALLAVRRAKAGGAAADAPGVFGGLPPRIASTPQAMSLLALAREAGPEALQAFLTASTGEGPDGAAREAWRVIACDAALRRDPETPAAEALKTAVVGGCERLLARPASKIEMARVWNLPLRTGKLELAGGLLARAIELEGPPEDLPFLGLLLAENTPDREARGPFGRGVAEAGKAGASSAFLKALGDAIGREPPDRAALLPALEAAAAQEGSRAAALLLSARVAASLNDAPKSEAAARRLLEIEPESQRAKEALADALLAQRKFPEVLQVHPEGPPASFTAARQRVAALVETGDKDAAVTVARAALQAFPRNADAYLLLAGLHESAGRADEALGVLNVAPSVRSVELRRAELLARRKEFLVAEMIYEGLLARESRDVDAWRGLGYMVGTEEGRYEDVVARLTQQLGAPGLPATDPVRAELLVLRGIALEGVRRYEPALVDYEAALEIAPRNVTALNNAAWILVHHAKDGLPRALGYIERALEAAPAHPSIQDTAANCYLAAGDAQRALKHIDRALELQKKASYMMTRGRVLNALNRLQEARTQFIEVGAQFPGTQEAADAAEIVSGMAAPR